MVTEITEKMGECFVIALCLSILIQFSNGEVYTALADLEEILETESILISALKHYIRAEEQKLNLLRR